MELAGKASDFEARARIPGSPPVDIKLGFAASEDGPGKLTVDCAGGSILKGEGKEAKNVAMTVRTARRPHSMSPEARPRSASSRPRRR